MSNSKSKIGDAIVKLHSAQLGTTTVSTLKPSLQGSIFPFKKKKKKKKKSLLWSGNLSPPGRAAIGKSQPVQLRRSLVMAMATARWHVRISLSSVRVHDCPAVIYPVPFRVRVFECSSAWLFAGEPAVIYVRVHDCPAVIYPVPFRVRVFECMIVRWWACRDLPSTISRRPNASTRRACRVFECMIVKTRSLALRRVQ